MTISTYKPFGTVITNSQNQVDFSKDAGFKIVSKTKDQECMSDIISSAVGDFTERPLQIMIREIAKNFLIFTPIGWIVLLYIIARRYKGKLNYAFKNLKIAMQDTVKSLCEEEESEKKDDTQSATEE